MSVVLVTGGTGVLGTAAVLLLRDHGHEVRVLSRRQSAGTHRGDLTSGEGLMEAVDGAELVAHAASDTRRFGRADVQQTRHLIAAAQEVSHLLYVSIVGIDAMPYGYYRRKLACEGELAASTIPHTILRATQFHELGARMLTGAGRLPVAPLPLDWRFQTVAAREVAERIVGLLGQPPGQMVNFGGPAVLDLRSMLDTWRQRHRRPRMVTNLPVPGRLARALRQGLNTCPDYADGRQSWAEYIDTLQ